MSLAYAETHFKFRLPWSPLWRPWPEIFLDAPSFCLPGRPCPIYLAVKDAHHFPIRLIGLEILIQGPEGKQKWDLPLGRELSQALEFIPLPIGLAETPGHYSLHAKIHVRNAKGRETQFWQANYPFLPPRPLEIQRLSQALPYPAGWQAGEMHCHSDYSSDPVEFGAPLSVLQAAGQALGLDFIQVTDHSYDFGYRKEAYMEPCDPQAVFAAYRQEAAAINASQGQGQCRLLPGEEISCGNALGENVHLLAMGHPEFVPGMGDGGRRGLQNRPDLRIEEVLERLGTTPCFAAHPRVRIGGLERFIFRRGPWDHADLGKPGPSPLRGLQFWNGSRSRDYWDGRRFWVESLLRGHRLLPIGANDAHGDLNQNVGVKFPLFSLYRSRSHVLGKVRTLFPSPTSELPDLQAAARLATSTATDGPFASLVLRQGRLEIRADSQNDFGALKQVSLVYAKTGERQEKLAKQWQPRTLTLEQDDDFPEGAHYTRLEVETESGRFALTSAVFRD